MKIIFDYSGIGKLAYSTRFSSGADLIAQRNYVLLPAETQLISTGLFIKDFTFGDDDDWIPEVQIRPRSSLSKKGILCHFGTVDVDYRNEIKVCLTNLTNDNYEIMLGNRIAQLVCAAAYRSNTIAVEAAMRQGGFGSTGA